MVARSKSVFVSLAELMACHLPAVLVPFPHAAANHQYFNARILEQAGCAKIVYEGENMTDRLHSVLNSIETPDLAEMSKAYTAVKIPNPLAACKKITEVLEKL